VNLITSVALLVLLPLGLSLFFGVGLLAAKLSGRRFMGMLTSLGLLVGLLVLADALFEALSVASTAQVVSKDETLTLGRTGLAPSVSRRLRLLVASGPALALAHHRRPVADLEFEVSETVYDAMKTGDTVQMHEVRVGPFQYARLANEPWWDWLRMVAEFVDIGPDRDRLLSSSANVTSRRTVTENYTLSLTNARATELVVLKQPYDEVQFRFTTEDGRDIVALDRVDAGSAGSLLIGESVLVRYAPLAPREGRLQQGQRRYLWVNRLAHWRDGLLVFVGALFSAVTLWRVRAWIVRRSVTTPTSLNRRRP
jgi:hypothetical protein